MMPHFIFIVPCYNVEKYIEKCVESIIQQQYKNYEIILMDDVSSDGTKTICNKLSQKYPKVKVLPNQYNVGGAIIRNRILEYISKRKLIGNEWICFLDSDDEILPGSLCDLAQIINHNSDIDFLLTGFRYVYPNDTMDIVPQVPSGCYKSEELISMVEGIIPWEIISCCGNKIYKLEFIYDNKLEFNTEYYAYNEDGGFAVEALTAVKKIYFADIPFYFYYQRNGSTMHSYRANPYYTINHVIQALECLFRKKGQAKEFLIARKRLGLVYAAFYNEAFYGCFDKYSILFDDLKTDIEVIYACRKIMSERQATVKEKIQAYFILHNMKKMMRVLLNISIKRSRKTALFG